MPEARLHIPPAAFAEVALVAEHLGCSEAMAQVLVRRGFDVDSARAWLAAEERHTPDELDGAAEAAALVLRHVARGSRIVVHGDYDVDGVCSTAILVRVLRSLGGAGSPRWGRWPRRALRGWRSW
jgi:single-stranded-DNA-specific exonuclease